jgi:multiple sugar transport system permease protein
MTAAAEPIQTRSTTQVVRAGDRGAVWRRRIAYVFLIGYAILMLIPFAWSVITSFKTLPDSVKLTIIPDPFTLQAWEFAWNNLVPPLPLMFLNSAIIAGSVMVTNIVFGSLAGYAFARLRFPLRETLFLLVLATLMIPDQLRMVPLYVMFSAVGLTRGDMQYVAVILILAVSASTVFLMRQFFLTMPRELEEAARRDGAGFFTTFFRVMLPLAGPAVAAVAILEFQGAWNSFFWPLIFMREQDNWPVQLGLVQFRDAGGFATNWPPLMATVVMATIPIVILYVFFQRYFVAGVAASGVKG